MILDSLQVGYTQANCYILAKDKNCRAIIIDPGDEEARIRKLLKKYDLTAGLIINTHGHIDHIGCDDKFGVPVYIHKDDKVLLDDAGLNLSAVFTAPYTVKSDVKILNDKDKVELEGMQLEVIHLPGHTPGGIALLMKAPQDNIVFTGDTLFYHSVGRTDFPGGDGKLIVKSIKERLFKLADETLIYPGHGPLSSIAEEKKNNRYCS
ncbi:MBL fold metallo-hydrolase [bacterium]|nr:MAG: MBL fold metallo-hydrolase [bacterium]